MTAEVFLFGGFGLFGAWFILAPLTILAIAAMVAFVYSR